MFPVSCSHIGHLWYSPTTISHRCYTSHVIPNIFQRGARKNHAWIYTVYVHTTNIHTKHADFYTDQFHIWATYFPCPSNMSYKTSTVRTRKVLKLYFWSNENSIIVLNTCHCYWLQDDALKLYNIHMKTLAYLCHIRKRYKPKILNATS